jgi:hypothetical protein
MGNPLDFTTADVITLTPSNPAAGADLSILVPVKTIIMPISLSITFNTAAVGGSRLMRFAAFDGVSFIHNWASSVTQIANMTRDYYSALGILDQDQGANGTGIYLSLPDKMLLRFGDSIQTRTHGMNAADQISDPIIRYLQWIVD